MRNRDLDQDASTQGLLRFHMLCNCMLSPISCLFQNLEFRLLHTPHKPMKEGIAGPHCGIMKKPGLVPVSTGIAS